MSLCAECGGAGRCYNGCRKVKGAQRQAERLVPDELHLERERTPPVVAPLDAGHSKEWVISRMQSVGLKHDVRHADYSQELPEEVRTKMLKDLSAFAAPAGDLCGNYPSRAVDGIGGGHCIDGDFPDSAAVDFDEMSLDPEHWNVREADRLMRRIVTEAGDKALHLMGWGTADGGVLAAGGAKTFCVTPMESCRLMGMAIEEPHGLLVTNITVGRYSMLSDPAGIPAAIFSLHTCSDCGTDLARRYVGTRWPDLPAHASVSITVLNMTNQARHVHGALVAESMCSVAKATIEAEVERQLRERAAEQEEAMREMQACMTQAAELSQWKHQSAFWLRDKLAVLDVEVARVGSATEEQRSTRHVLRKLLAELTNHLPTGPECDGCGHITVRSVTAPRQFDCKNCGNAMGEPTAVAKRDPCCQCGGAVDPKAIEVHGAVGGVLCNACLAKSR